MRMRVFSETWCRWIQAFTQDGNVLIKVNEQMGPYFQTIKGRRQVDPLSQILFNIVWVAMGRVRAGRQLRLVRQLRPL